MEQETKKKKKLPVFWIIYGTLMVLSLVAVGVLLNKLYYFLDAYETTRPVHYADKVMQSIFLPENRPALRAIITNKAEQDTESVEDILDLFYKASDNKELTYGRYFGHYTDERPQYIVSAGKEQLATFALKETVRYDDNYDFKLWELESVTLLSQAKYSYAVTIPETMTLFVNGKEVKKDRATGRKDSDCQVGYLEYSDAGFYLEPEIKVVDRIGQEVKLLCDEASGAYYYLLHYAYAPQDTVVSFNGTVLTENEVMEKGIDPDIDFFMLKEVIKKYSEYQGLAEQITYPTFVRYYVDIDVSEEGNAWVNRLGTESPVTYDAETKTFSAALVSDDTNKEQLVQLTQEFLEKYALFCSRDARITAIMPYFPNNSEYYEKISHLNNLWFQAHSKVSFQNHEVKEFFGYGENYAYVHIYFEQKMLAGYSGEWLIYQIDLPVWMVRIDEKWYVGGMDFDNFMSGFSSEEQR